jgi:hypothetical protein
MKPTLSIVIILATISVQHICFAQESQSIGKTSKDEVFTPENVLPKGIDKTVSINPYTGESAPVRKGTVAAMLNNVALLNKALAEAPINQAKVEELMKANAALISSLRAVGMFHLFLPIEWLASDDQQGRILTAVLYLQKYPKEMTPQVRGRLIQIKNHTKIKVLSDAIEKALKS